MNTYYILEDDQRATENSILKYCLTIAENETPFIHHLTQFCCLRLDHSRRKKDVACGYLFRRKEQERKRPVIKGKQKVLIVTAPIRSCLISGS